MGFIQKIINKRKAKKTPEYLEYLSMLDLNKLDTQRFLNYYERATANINEMLDSGISPNAKELLAAKEEMQRWYYAYVESVKAKDFIRPNSKEEIDERNRIANTFGDNLFNIVGPESDLRFHGTPIYFAKDIIESKSISSTADRFEGYIKSTDLKGEFSASNINSIDRTINFFTDFGSYRRCLPCGVLFVLKEKEGDEPLRKQSTMQNVNFDTNPEQLVGIVCTLEVLNMVTAWCHEYGVDTSKVFTYDTFLSNIKSINEGTRRL